MIRRHLNIALTLASLALLALLVGACGQGGDQQPGTVGASASGAANKNATGGGPKVMAFVSIIPQAYFVRRVGGDHVQTEILVGPGQSPHTFEPTPKTLNKLAAAQLYFRVGMPFEETLLTKISATFANLRVVDTRRGIKLRNMTAEEEAAEAAGERAEAGAGLGTSARHGSAAATADVHDDSGLDPHIWLSLRLVKVQSRTICDELAKVDPVHEADYRRNLAAFEADLDQLDARIAQVLAPLKGREFFVYHPAYGYFADDYGLRQVAVEAGGREPNAKQLGALIGKARAAGVKVIFVQPQFSQKTAEAVAKSIGGAVVALDTLPPDYLKTMGEMADRIELALAAPPAAGIAPSPAATDRAAAPGPGQSAAPASTTGGAR